MVSPVKKPNNHLTNSKNSKPPLARAGRFHSRGRSHKVKAIARMIKSRSTALIINTYANFNRISKKSQRSAPEPREKTPFMVNITISGFWNHVRSSRIQRHRSFWQSSPETDC